MQNLSQEEECAIIRDAQSGNRDAMERIIMQYWPLVLAAGRQRYVWSITEDAVGAAAEELVRSVQAFDAARGVPFAAFAKVRVYGAVSHLFRKMCRTWEHESAPCEADVWERIADEGTFDASEARLMLAPMLVTLSDIERRVLFFLYGCGKSTYETADALGVSQSKVMRIKREAIRRMREALTA